MMSCRIQSLNRLIQPAFDGGSVGHRTGPLPAAGLGGRGLVS